jgi:hypothetical protein
MIGYYLVYLEVQKEYSLQQSYNKHLINDDIKVLV